jgi:hypothetical protein
MRQTTQYQLNINFDTTRLRQDQSDDQINRATIDQRKPRLFHNNDQPNLLQCRTDAVRPVDPNAPSTPKAHTSAKPHAG